MQISKRTVAREWLIFLSLFCLGCPVSFFLGHFAQFPSYYGHRPYSRYSGYGSYDDFWNHRFGLDNPWNLAAWLVPYFAVTLIRSIWWSIKTLNISKRALYGAGVGILVMVAAIVTIAINTAKEKERKAAVSRAESDEAYSAQLLRRNQAAPNIFDQFDSPNKLDEAKAYLLKAADNWHIANRLDQEKRVRQEETDLDVPDWARAAPSTARFAWKTNIVTTVFWIGEKQSGSAWDGDWEKNYGGFDNPERSARRNYIPVAFVPRENPFYCALPYNDVTDGQFKPEAPLVIPWFKQAYSEPGHSVCQHRWVSIRKGNRTCYAQWEDCGPFLTDHFQYVFQNERPKPNRDHGAGLNVSPAVRDYLGLAQIDVTDWQFVDVRDVPPGPWRSYGENNHFVIARRQMEQRAIQQTQDKNKPKE